jgi:hypothetical protein
MVYSSCFIGQGYPGERIWPGGRRALGNAARHVLEGPSHQTRPQNRCEWCVIFFFLGGGINETRLDFGVEAEDSKAGTIF